MRVNLRSFTALAAVILLAASTLLASGPAPERKRRPDFATGTRRPNRPNVAPTIPLADRSESDKVFLEHADTLRYRQNLTRDPLTGLIPEQYQVLVGGVKFRKGGMVMTCDSAYFYEGTNSFDAFSRVRMEQGDTLFVFCDELNYDGEQEIAVASAYSGRNVRLINRDVTLKTEMLNYDMNQEVGYYTLGGSLSDKQNTLTSREGEYFPSTKQSYFYGNVVLAPVDENDPSRLYTDTLEYNTGTHIAEIVDHTLIVGRDGDIVTTSGTYNTETGEANLYRRSSVKMRRGNTLTGDTIDYSRDSGIGIARGNVVVTDSARQSAIEGMYAFYDENIDSAFVTGRAVAKEYSKGDTLYLHGDTINAYTDPVDSARITNAFHRVRFYRSDLQGLCDSLSFVDLDSTIYLYRSPIVWSADRQIFGESIELLLNDSTIERAYLPEAGFIAEHIAEDCYNQLSGKDIRAWFEDAQLRRVTVEGSLQMIMFPMENDSTYNKYAFIESTSMDAYFKDNNLERGLIQPDNTGHVTPLFLARPGSYFLEKFAWFESLRPEAPGDIFVIPEQMITLIEQAPAVKPRKREPRVKPGEEGPTGGDLPAEDVEVQAVDPQAAEEAPEPVAEDSGPDPDQEAEAADDPETEDDPQLTGSDTDDAPSL